MRRLIILIGAVASMAAVVALAWTAPTVVVAAPLWIMLLCVATGWRSAPAAETGSRGSAGETGPHPDRVEAPLTVLPGGLVEPTGSRHAAS